jgi:hypothetical protein
MVDTLTENRTWSIWQKHPRKNMSIEEVKKFEVEGQYLLGNLFCCPQLVCILENRVQFARAEAEFLRWLEQVEIKHAEIERVFNYYKKMVSLWAQLAERAEHTVHPCASPGEKAEAAGKAAYARRTAHHVWAGLTQRMEQRLKGLGISELRTCSDGNPLPDRIRAWRLKEIAKHFPDYK